MTPLIRMSMIQEVMMGILAQCLGMQTCHSTLVLRKHINKDSSFFRLFYCAIIFIDDLLIVIVILDIKKYC